MKKIAIYGKGGVGKSTIASNLSISMAKKGLKVLHIGCDPKHDSTLRIVGRSIPTVMDTALKGPINKNDIVIRADSGIDCIECGGPKPGVGCAGRGIIKMFEILEDLSVIDSYDVVIFDVLGDVVCGGFAAPLRKNLADEAYIVVSEEFMSLYAANNILHALKTYERNGVEFGGIIINQRHNDANLTPAAEFIKKTCGRLIGTVPRSELITESESAYKTVTEKFPSSDISQIFDSIAEKTLKKKEKLIPRILSDDELSNVFAYR